MIINFVNLSRIFLLLFGLSIHQSKSDSIRNGIIMNGANETVDGSIDKSAVQQPSVDDVIGNGSTQPSNMLDAKSEISIDQHLEQYLANHAGATVLRPEKKDDTSELKTISFNGRQDIKFVIHLLDINKYTNYMQISFTSAQATKQIYNFTEIIKPTTMKIITFSDIQKLEIFLEFGKSEFSRYQGYVITYELYDKNTPEGNGSAVMQLHPLDKLSVLIEVPESKQVNETWMQFRALLATSTNKYIDSTGMNVETKCSVDNVTFDNVSTCKAAWSNAQKCIEIDFSIRLKAKNDPTIKEMNDMNREFNMNRDELFQMWIEFGRQEFADNGYNEFPVPDSKKLLLLWTTVSLVTIAAFLMVLTAIWKMDVLRDYRRMYWKSGDDEKQICKSSDGTMYPPVHQTVPTLFPNDLSAPCSTSNAIPFDFVSKPISYSINDFKRRSSIAESLNPNGTNAKRKAGKVPFQSDTDFSESKQDRPEDEVYFSNSDSTSPRLVN
ncbi:uncharacterized protein LOC116337470 [Contarinia nasturtii]|uniref:uncharacterized protein LOC116337470 n=1 Tax=Contarinia nasturtii TaxID=265458 RepID=UPI0012D37D1F|nr:uncharacterized protein LOC116337470 [Contarinia nasturtii]